MQRRSSGEKPRGVLLNRYGLISFTLLVFAAIMHGGVEIWSGSVLVLIVVIMLFGWCFTVLHDARVTMNRTFLDIPLLVCIVVVVISAFDSVYPYASKLALMRYGAYAAFFWIVVNRVGKREEITWFVWALVLFGSLYATMGLLFTGSDLLGLRIFSKDQYSITLFFRNKNHFAGYLEIITWLSLGLALANRGGRRLFLLVLALYCSLAIMFSLSRGGIISHILCFLVFLVILISRRTTRRDVLPFSVLLLLLIIISLMLDTGPFLERIKTMLEPEKAGWGRMEFWRGCLAMISEYPWTGSGIGTFMHAYPRFQTWTRSSEFVNYAHNDYLELITEIGIPGFLVVLSVVLVYFVFSIRALLSMSDVSFGAIGLGALMGCLNIMLHSFVEFHLKIPSNAFLLAAGAAIVHGVITTDKQHSSRLRFSIPVLRKGRPLPHFLIFLLHIYLAFIVVKPLIGDHFAHQARQLMNGKKVDRALDAGNTAIWFEPDNAEHHITRGDILYATAIAAERPAASQHFFHQAQTAYEKAISLCPVRGYFHTKRALVLLRLGENEEAERSLRQAIIYSPNIPFNYYYMAHFHLEHGAFDDALALYRQFLLRDDSRRSLDIVFDELWSVSPSYETLRDVVPAQEVHRKRFALFLRRKGDQKAWLDELEYIFQLSPTPGNALDHLNSLISVKRYETAIEVANNYLEHFKGDISLKRKLAEIYTTVKSLPEAEAIYVELILEHPGEITLYLAYSNFLMSLRKYSESIDILLGALERMPNSAELHFRIALGYRQLNRYQETLDHLKKALFFKRDHAPYLYHLGLQYKLMGLTQLAVDRWRECLELSGQDKNCQRALEQVLSELAVDGD